MRPRGAGFETRQKLACLLQLSQAGVNERQIRDQSRVLSSELDRFLELLDGVPEISLGLADPSEHPVRFGKVRIHVESRLDSRFGARKVAGEVRNHGGMGTN